ncbi:hypothetical protein CSPX01_08530 [Colletotrichum filicis]|nr:hypothetical protein CSPX01_08530 [Colletotrichum filicis]
MYQQGPRNLFQPLFQAEQRHLSTNQDQARGLTAMMTILTTMMRNLKPSRARERRGRVRNANLPVLIGNWIQTSSDHVTAPHSRRSDTSSSIYSDVTCSRFTV